MKRHPHDSVHDDAGCGPECDGVRGTTMLEATEAGQTLSEAAFARQTPGLRVALINAQYDLSTADFPVIVVLAGDDRLGCNATLNTLHEWMDARYLEAFALRPPSDEELERPRLWRFWRTLPGRGQLGIYFGGWSQQVVADRARRKIGERQFARRLAHGALFERTLVADGALVLKFWLHVSKREHKRRLKRAGKRDRAIDDRDWAIYEHYDRGMPLAERMLRETSTGGPAWHILESTDARFRDVFVARTILEGITTRLAERKPRRRSRARRGPAGTGERPVLAGVDLSFTLPRKRYKTQLARLQTTLARLTREAALASRTSVLVFEGWDAAGKGGVIRRLTNAIDARDYRVVAIAAPTPAEAAHHYLWRFWRHLPRAGTVLIFDRSWYGRVLVERVEGFARTDEWCRAYDEINDFEQQLVEHGILVRKFWLHLDQATQLERFRAREETPYKKYKITEEDYRNRERWQDYEAAVDEMVTRTHTKDAPWTLVPSNDKRVARVEVLRTVCKGLKQAARTS